MKTKILSILLTVAMLVAMVPMIAVSAEEETGTTYEVGSIADVKHFLGLAECDCTTETCKYAGGNATGNTMKLTADLTYEATGSSGPGIWDGCKTDIDGNGHTVTLGGGNYYSAILFGFKDKAGNQRSSELTIKNLAIVMAVENGKQAVATRATSQYISLFGQLNDASQAALGTGCTINVENCYFDVNFAVTPSVIEVGAGILVARVLKNTATLTINAKNSYFKANFTTGVASGAETGSGGAGALVGRRVTPGDGAALNVSVENCVFDVTSNALNSGAVIGQTHENEKALNLTAKGTNLIYGGEDKVSTVTDDKTGLYEGNFTTVAAGETNVTTVKGYQTTAAVDNKFDLRLVGLVDVANVEDLANYSKVGFIVEASYVETDKTTTKWMNAASTKVYTSLKGYEGEDTGLVKYTAEELGGDYLYALAIKNIPASALNNGGITFTVKPYYVDTNGNAVFGAEDTFTVTSVPSDSANAAE